MGLHRENGGGWVVAEHGRHAGYVRNLEADPAVRVRHRGRWKPARAFVASDDDPNVRLRDFPRTHAASVRAMGTELLTIRIEFDGAAED